MTGNTLEQRARELLAAEMDAIGSSIAAGMLRDGWPASGATVPALRAITAALRLSAGADWVPWTDDQCAVFMSVAMRHCEVEGEFTWDDIRKGQRMADRATAPRHEPGEG